MTLFPGLLPSTPTRAAHHPPPHGVTWRGGSILLRHLDRDEEIESTSPEIARARAEHHARALDLPLMLPLFGAA